MIASQMIGVAAVLLVLIFISICRFFHKWRSLLILFLAFASAGLVGYSSASSIGIGWTVSLALLIFLGVAVTVVYLHQREDRQAGEQFDRALKGDPLALTTAGTMSLCERKALGEPGRDTTVGELSGELAQDGNPIERSEELEQAAPVCEHSRVWNGEAAEALVADFRYANGTGAADGEFAAEPADAESELATATSGEPHATGADCSDAIVTAPLDLSEPVREAAGAETAASCQQSAAAAATCSDSEPHPAVADQPDSDGPEPTAAAPAADLPATFETAEAADAKEGKTRKTAVVPQAILAASRAAARKKSSSRMLSTQELVMQTAAPLAKSSSTALRERIQLLSAEAERALLQGDYLRAYQALREAWTLPAPTTAAYILSRQLVQVLNEMGLYEESISVMEKVLREHPSLSTKKRKELSMQIAYLAELSRLLAAENKRNLSWSLVPPALHESAGRHLRSLLAGSHEHAPAIPFH